MSSPINITISKFGGLSSGLTPRKFLDDFSSYCTLCNVEDGQKVAAFQLHLIDEARSWLDDLTPEQKKSWSDVRQLFIRRFIDRNTANGPDYLHEQQLYQGLRLAPGQSIMNFYITLKEKGHSLQKSENDLLSHFINGLPSQLAFFVRAGNPTTPEQALTAARNGEAYGYRMDRLAANSNTEHHHANAVSHPPSFDLSSMQRQIDRLSAQIRSLTSQNRRPLPNNNNRQYPRQAIQCQLCNGLGHGAWACRRGRSLN